MRGDDVAEWRLVSRCLWARGIGGRVPSRIGSGRHLDVVDQVAIVIGGRGQVIGALPLVVDDELEPVRAWMESHDGPPGGRIVWTLGWGRLAVKDS